MDTLSFALGIATVVVIAVAIVAVYAFVEVRKVKQDNNFYRLDVDKRFEALEISLNREGERVDRRIDEVYRDVYSTLDSRLDKLENKFNNTK